MFKGPLRFNNQYSSYIFFLSFVIFGVMFLINLFTGVIFYNFTMAEKLTKHKYLSDSQVTWLNLHKLILLADPYFEYSSRPPLSPNGWSSTSSGPKPSDSSFTPPCS